MAGTTRDESRQRTDVDAAAETPRTESETVHDSVGDLAALLGIADDLDDVAAQIAAEFDFLTSLIWSPATAAAVHALVGDYGHRVQASGVPADRVPLNHPLFLGAGHAQLFQAAVDLVDEGTPVTPQILMARVGMTDRTIRPLLIAIGAPVGHAPLSGGVDVPHLARSLVDAYYRRGYLGLIAQMAHHADESPTEALAQQWATLTDYQQMAERRWLAVRDALAAL